MRDKKNIWKKNLEIQALVFLNKVANRNNFENFRNNSINSMPVNNNYCKINKRLRGRKWH